MTSSTTRTLICRANQRAVAELYVQRKPHCAGGDAGGDGTQRWQREESAGGREVLRLLLGNYAVAEETGLPMCQDTGLAVVMVELGQEMHLHRRHVRSHRCRRAARLRGGLSAHLGGGAPAAPGEYRRQHPRHRPSRAGARRPPAPHRAAERRRQRECQRAADAQTCRWPRGRVASSWWSASPRRASMPARR